MFIKANADKCVMTKWLAINEQNNIPKYPFTTIGVGALVTSSDGKVRSEKYVHLTLPTCAQILLMRERRPSAAYAGWKFPGGLADPGM